MNWIEKEEQQNKMNSIKKLSRRNKPDRGRTAEQCEK